MGFHGREITVEMEVKARHGPLVCSRPYLSTHLYGFGTFPCDVVHPDVRALHYDTLMEDLRRTFHGIIMGFGRAYKTH